MENTYSSATYNSKQQYLVENVGNRMKMKNSEEKKSKGFFSAMSETYKDFAENTSIHGLKYTVKNEIDTWEKIFWISVVICGLCCATYMTILFWERYISNPTRTTILTSYAPTTSIPFPAVTLCNINRILLSKVDSFIETLDLNKSEKSVMRKGLPQLLALTNPNSIKYNLTELEIVHDILDRNEFGNISFVMEKLSQNCDDMLVYCSWNYDVVNCSDIFGLSLSIDGFCCSFNYGKTRKFPHLYTKFNGQLTGLVAVLNPMLQPFQYSTLYSSGFKVIIHDPEEYPGAQSTAKIVSVGKLSYLQIQGTKMICSDDVRNLPMSQRHCSIEDESKLKYLGEKYSDSNCLTECGALYYAQHCGCAPFYLSFLNIPICNISQIPCIKAVRTAQSDPKRMKDCECVSQCEDDLFGVLSTSTPFKYNESKSVISLESIPMDEHTIFLNVFFLSQRQTVYMRDTITSSVYLLSSFGGVYSLFMGCSLITIVEVVYYCLFRFLVNLKFMGRVHTDVNDISTISRPRIRNFNFGENIRGAYQFDNFLQ